MKTYSAKPNEVQRRWYVVDAQGQILGRLASRIAEVLRGKHKPEFTPHVDMGDFVVVVNAREVALSGNKRESKWYHKHSGYPGGLKSLWYGKLLETHPERAIEKAVWGMLPKTSLGRRQLRKLKVYAGPDHPHAAQKPQPFPFRDGSAAAAAPAPTRGEETPPDGGRTDAPQAEEAGRTAVGSDVEPTTSDATASASTEEA